MIPYLVVVGVLFVATLKAVRRRQQRWPVPATRKDVLCLTLFQVFWLGPILHLALIGKPMPSLPYALTDLHGISCLFTRGTEAFSVYYVQVLLKEGEPWMTIPEEPFFQMQVFGYRSRLHRLLGRSRRKSGEARRKEVAAWIRDRYAAWHPNEPVPVGVRFMQGIFMIGRETPPQGRWRKPPLASLPPDSFKILSSHEFETAGGER